MSSSAGSGGSPAILDVLRSAADLQAVCDENRWEFCFIGGLALQRWGEPRMTVDVDLTLLPGFGGEATYVDELLRLFQPRIQNAREFALENRVLLLRSESGVGLDIALGGLDFEVGVVKRSSWFEFTDTIRLRTCSAEDLVVMKAFAGRGQDWVDVDGILARQAGSLDWTYVVEQLAPLAELKGEPELVEELQRRRDAQDG